MASPTSPDNDSYAGHSRFTIELEFVQALSNPYYLNYLAAQKYFDDPAFVNYLDYLQYWQQPRYTKFLSYPEVTLRVLEMLQQERFRKEILSPDVAARLAQSWATAAQNGHG